MSPLFLDIIIKATALVIAAGAADAVLGRRRASAATRHLVWSIAITGMLALPVASYALPHWQVRIPVARTFVAAAGRAFGALPLPADSPVANAPVRPTSGLTVMQPSPADAPGDVERSSLMFALGIVAVTYVIYVGGVAILFGRLGRESLVLRRLARASHRVSDPAWRHLLEEGGRQLRITRHVHLLQSAGELMPMTFGTREPTVVLPASADAWTEDRRRAVILHELAHVARRDCLMQRLTAVACALYWPHPGVWWAARRLRVERELACDDRVLAAGEEAREYAGHLLDLARSLGTAPAPATALAMARARQLENRLLAVLDVGRNRAALRREGFTVAIAVSIAVLLPMAALRAGVVPVDRPAGASSALAFAAQDVTGTWEIRPSRDGGFVQLNLRTLHGSHGTTVPLARLEGLTASQMSNAGGAVRFASRRDAGTLTFDGVCRNGLCAGTYAFEPRPAFAAELAKRGIGTPSPQELYELALEDVGIAWLDELSAEGYQKPDVHGMVRAAEHGVDLDYVRSMATLGYRLGTVDALLVLRDHGVDPEYVREMAANGFAHVPANELVGARDHGVDPAYVKGMRALGYAFSDLAHLITARDHGVDPAFANGLAALGYKNVSLDALTTARDHGVDPEYVRGMRSFGFDLTLDDLRRTRDHGVDPEYVRGLAALGYQGVPLETLIRMRDHGVDPDYIRRLQQRGVAHPSADELIQRRDRGDGDPDAAARATVASFHSLWRSVEFRLARITAWLRS